MPGRLLNLLQLGCCRTVAGWQQCCPPKALITSMRFPCGRLGWVFLVLLASLTLGCPLAFLNSFFIFQEYKYSATIPHQCSERSASLMSFCLSSNWARPFCTLSITLCKAGVVAGLRGTSAMSLAVWSRASST